MSRLGKRGAADAERDAWVRSDPSVQFLNQLERDFHIMSKMSELAGLLDELIDTGKTMEDCAQQLIRIAQAVKELFSSEPMEKEEEVAPELPPSKTYTKEEVRSILAGLAQNGFREESKALVRKYADGGSLTDVPPEKYADLVREAEEIGNA